MGSFMDFADTLERRLRREMVRPEPTLEREQDLTPRGMAWILGATPRAEITASRGKTAYGVKARPLPPYNLTFLEREAVDFFAEWGVSLSPRFPKGELKKAFRSLAKRLHPDGGGAPQAFRNLKIHTERLEKMLAGLSKPSKEKAP